MERGCETMRRVLLLNSSEEIISVIGWQRAAILYLTGKAKKPHNYDDFHDVKIASGIFRLPTALILVTYVRIPFKHIPITKENVLRRDGHECLATGTLIQRKDQTWVEVDNIHVGDEVRTASGYGIVSAKRKKRKKNGCVTVKPYYGLPITVTRDHLCLTEKDGVLKFEEAKDLRGKRLVFPVDPRRNKRMRHNLLKLLGYYASEGCVDRRYGKACYTVFTIGPDETDLARSIKQCARSEFGVTNIEDKIRTDSRNGNTYRFIRIYSRRMAEYLSASVPGKAREKCLTFEPLSLSRSCLETLIESMMWGDGCDHKVRDSDCRILSTSSIALALQFQRMLWRIGGFASIVCGKQVNFNPGASIYQIRWFPRTEDHLGKIVNISGSDYLSVPVQYIKETVYNGYVWDISIQTNIELERSFVTPAGIVHNCQFCGQKLRSAEGTIDHVVPTSRGGKHAWGNVVAACKKCNNHKDNRTPDEAGMKLACRPFVPTHDLLIMTAYDLRTNRSWTRWIMT